MTILGYEADAGSPPLPRRQVHHRFAGQCDAPGRSRRQTEQGVDQLRLPVALDAGNPDDLALPHDERDALEHRAAFVGEECEVRHLEEHLFLDGRLLRLRGRQLGPDHHLRQLAGVDLGWCGGPHRLPVPHDRYPIRNGQHLVEFVRDEDDGVTFFPEVPDRVE